MEEMLTNLEGRRFATFGEVVLRRLCHQSVSVRPRSNFGRSAPARIRHTSNPDQPDPMLPE